MTHTYDYPMPSVTVDVVLFSPNKSHILCVKRKYLPFMGEWACPGGFLDLSETLKQSAVRELREETNIVLDESELQFVGVFDAVNRDERNRVISTCFTAVLKNHAMPRAADDAAAAEWKATDRLRAKDVVLAFDHYDMIMRACEVVRYEQ
jgi:8-oxo-dGTP diphosphatase